MEVALGFLIAVMIALTGVGAGSMTTPLLILLVGTSAAKSVGTALAFGFIVKAFTVPVYFLRKQVNFRVLLFLLLGGLPGVIGGSLLLAHLQKGPHQGQLQAAVGLIIAATAIFHLWRMRSRNANRNEHDRAKLLPLFSLPIGVEVGFSSAGSGALGSLLLLGMTKLTAAEVVGTDLCFGLALAFVGGGFQLGIGNYDQALLLKLAIGGIAGALVGATLAGKIAQRPLRVGLLIMLILLGCQLFWRGIDVKKSSPPLASQPGVIALPAR